MHGAIALQRTLHYLKYAGLVEAAAVRVLGCFIGDLALCIYAYICLTPKIVSQCFNAFTCLYLACKG